MADNVAITPGSGATVAADDVGGVLYQRVKIGLGADASATDMLGGAGAAAAGVIRTVTATDSPDVTTLGSILTELQAQATSVPHEALDATSDLTHAFVTSSASGEVDLVSATAAQTSRIHRMTITAAAATVVEIRDGAGGTALKTIEFPAAGAYVFDFSSRPYAVSSTNTKLVRNSTVATKVTIDFEYKKS